MQDGQQPEQTPPSDTAPGLDPWLAGLGDPFYASLVCVAEVAAGACSADGVRAEWTPATQPWPALPERIYERQPAGPPQDGVCLEAANHLARLRVTLTRQSRQPGWARDTEQRLSHLAAGCLACLCEASRSPQPPLSASEQQVLDLLLRGGTLQQVAVALGRSPNTVHSHVKSIYRKLGVRTRGELLARFPVDQDNTADPDDLTELRMRHGLTHAVYAARINRPPDSPPASES